MTLTMEELVLRLFTNQVLYLIYVFALIGGAAVLEIHRYLGIARRSFDPDVKRGDESMSVIHGTFVVVTGVNLGIAQVVFTFMPSRIGRFSFVIMLVETIAWAYLIYWNASFRNWLIGWAQRAYRDRR